MAFSFFQIVVMAVLILISAFIKTGFGVGAGVFLSATLCLIVPPKTAIAIGGPVMFLTDILPICHYRKEIRNSIFFLLMFGSLCGIIVGGVIVNWIPDRWFIKMVGFFCGVFALQELIRFYKTHLHGNTDLSFPARPLPRWVGFLIGLLGGTVSAISHMGGIVYSMYMLRLRMAKDAFVGMIGLGLVNSVQSAMVLSQEFDIIEHKSNQGPKMRRKLNRQTNLFTVVSSNPIARELEEISKIIDANSGVLDLVYQDLVKAKRHDTGREGLTAEQVLRSCILKQYHQLSYEELAFHLEDSSAFRTFSRLEMGQYPCKSILQENIKSLSEETWEAIHSRIIDYAQDEKIETGRKIRIDSTAIETDIHHPTDSTLLCDGIRVISRWLSAGKQLSPQPVYPFSDHARAAKRRLMVILNTRKEKVRLAAYRELLSYAQRVVVYAEAAVPALRSFEGADPRDSLAALGLARNLERAVGIFRKVIDQTVRRVIKGEKVPASEKVVSFFEDHTDIIVKGRRDTQFGHKVFLTGGASNLILDCLIERGNPADTDRYQDLLERHKEQFGRVPRQVSADGGFASRNN